MKFLAQLMALMALLITVPAQAATIKAETSDGETTIIIAGEIVEGDDESFRRYATQYPDANVALWSPGGSLVTALEIGRMVHINRYTTIVLKDYQCASACALIWIAGSTRMIEEGGKVGFHAGYRNENGRQIADSAANAVIGGYLNSLNLPTRAVIFATSASPDRMYWLDTRNPGAEGIDYEIFGNEEVAPPVVASSAQKLDGKKIGKWEIADRESFSGVATPSADSEAALGFICPNDKACRFALMTDLTCDPGDRYSMYARIEGYETQEIGMTCDVKGEMLYLDDSASLEQALRGETRFALAGRSQTGETKAYVFSLIGFAEAVDALQASGRIVTE